MRKIVRVCEECKCIIWKRVDDNTKYCLYCGKQFDKEKDVLKVVDTKNLLVKYGLRFIQNHTKNTD